MSEQSISLDDIYLFMLQYLIDLQSPVQKLLQICLFQRFKDKDLTAGQKGSDDFKRWIFSRSSYEHYGSVFNGSEQSVLLRLAEAMDFIYEKNRG